MLLTDFDRRRLENLVALMRQRTALDHPRWVALEDELDGAEVIQQAQVPPNVVTMNSVVELLDLDTGQPLTLKLTFPQAEGCSAEQVSVLSLLGLALLGSREEDELSIPSSTKAQRLRVVKVLYQPEAAGNFAL